MALRRQVLERDGWRCVYCGIDLRNPATRPTADHIVPREHGGLDVMENLVAACFRDNRAKGVLSLEEFLRRRASQAGRGGSKASRRW